MTRSVELPQKITMSHHRALTLSPDSRLTTTSQWSTFRQRPFSINIRLISSLDLKAFENHGAMSIAKRGFMHSLHVPYWNLCVLFVVLFLVLTTGVSAQRNQVEITERNVQRFERLLSRADPRTEFILSTDAELSSTLSITANRIILRGNSSDARPVIRCRTENEVAFQISSDRVQFVDLIIRDCRGTAVSVSSVVGSDNPFAQQETVEPVRLEVEFRNVDFVNNTGTQSADAPGALFIGRRVEAEIQRCNFIGNSASVGGAIRSLGTSLQITNSVFRNNTGTNSGGAIRGDANREDRQDPQRSLLIRNSQFFENRVLVGNEDRGELTITSGVPLEANQYLKFPLPSPSGGALHLAYFGSVSITDSEFEGNSAVPAGGAIHLSDNGETEIQNCSFRRNSADQMTSNNANAQDLQVGGAMFVAFSDISSRLEIRGSEFVDNQAVYGGAIHVVAPIASNIALFTTVFRRNVASLGGGALVFRNVDSPEITRCDFLQNSAFVGGAIFVTNGAGFKSLEGLGGALSNFRNNFAYDGGAIFGIGSGTVQIFSTFFQRNQAQRHGGAVCFIDSKAGGELGLQDTRMFNNTAEKGGALFVENLDRITFSIGPNDRNREAVFGGDSERLRNEFFGNEAVAGGAIFYRASNLVSNSFNFGQCDFVDNRVHSNLSSLYDEPLDYPRTSQDLPRGLGNRRLRQDGPEGEESMVLSLLDPVGIDPCYPGGGGAVCLVLSGISQRVPVSVSLSDSLFENNTADVAGGLFLSTDEEVDWVSRCPPVDQATSTLLTSDPCRSLRLRNLTFINNSARYAGGGIFASNLTHVLYSAAPDEVTNDRYRPLFRVASRAEFRPNSVQDGGYGPNIASMADQLQIQEPSIDANTGLLINNHSSGQSNHLPPIYLQVVDRLGQIVTAGIQDSSLRVHVSAILPGNNTPIASGQIDSVAEGGIANFSALALSAPSGVYNIEFLPPRDSIIGVSGQVELRPCFLGEINKTDDFFCDVCLFEAFTFDTLNRRCDPCPQHARCKGGASLIPEPKYWHSSPFSTIMHECFHNDACTYERRTVILEEAHFSGRFIFLNRVRQEDPEFTNEEYPQCSSGYQGPLCGACEEGYGRTDGKTCEKCSSRSGTAAVVFLLAVWQLLLLSVTIRSALVSIRDMNQMMTIIGQSTSTITGGPSVSAVPTQRQVTVSGTVEDPGLAGLAPEQIEEAYAQRHNLAGQSSTMVLPAMAKQKASIDFIIAAQHVSETIKIFVNFFQVTSVAVNINVEWTTTIKNMLATMNSIAGFSNGATFTPMTCMLDDASDNRSILGVVLRIVFPLFLMLLVLVFFALQWMIMMRTPNYTRAYCSSFLKSRVVILFLVVVFFSYQSISEELMSTVSCIELDSKEIDDDTRYPDYSIARDRYWTEDTNIQCFERKHAYLAGFLGIPGIVFFLLGVPVYLLFFLLYKRSQGQLLELNVLNTYGFIYQNYEERFVYWEVCILLRKALIGAIIVFAYPLGANLQGVMALGVLILALAIHLIAAPFKYLLLNVLEGCSLLVSIFTFYAGVVFNDENTTDTADILLSALLVLINLSLVTVFLVCVFKYGDKYVVAKLKFLGVHDIPANFLPRVVKLARVVAGQAASSLANTLRQTLKGPPTTVHRSVSFGSNPRSPNTFRSVPAQSASSSPRSPDHHVDETQGNGGAEINIEMVTEESPNGAEEHNV